MAEDTKWENGVVNIAGDVDFPSALDQVGNDGWEPWAILGVDPVNHQIRIAVKRHKRTISIATEMPKGNGLIT